MVRLRSHEMPTARSVKTAKTEVVLDPVQLYQRYMHNYRMAPKAKEPVINGTNRGPASKKQCLNKPSVILRPPKSGLDTNRSQIKNPSKPSIEIHCPRTKARPKTPSSKRKPVVNLMGYEHEPDKKVTFQADEIECFFDALKETVEEVVQAKLSSMVNAVVEILSKKIEDVVNKSQKIEGTVANLFGDLSNKVTYYGEEHNRQCKYICMKLEYDKMFYQNMGHLPNGEQPKFPERCQQSSQASSHEAQQCSCEFSQPRPISSTCQLPDAAPACSHVLPPQNLRESTPYPMAPSWSHQAGDSEFNAQVPQMPQTSRPFNHSQSGPFQRVASCQTARNYPRQVGGLCKSASDSQKEPTPLCNRVSQSKSEDVAFVSSGNEKIQLGIKEFLDNLKVFQLNLNNRDCLVKGKSQLEENAKPDEHNSALSLMDTDESSSECIVSNGMISSDSTLNADNSS